LIDVSFEVEAGSATAFLGPNGAGKSTLARALAGLVRSSGAIYFDDHPIQGTRPNKIASLGISLVPEGRRVFTQLSVLDNLRVGGHSMSNASLVEDIDRMFTLFPILGERQQQKGGALSGGQQQMLAIARALMSRPKLIILDEPTEGIMPRLVSQIRREIHRINQSGVSILLVEQNVETALKLCPRVFLMEKGTIVHSGASHELKSQPEIVHRYLGLSH
jgi:branched-chain amino acid transport system ATP-binding protein